MRKTLLFLLVIITYNSTAQQPKQWSSSEIFQKIQKLHVLGNVLYLAAHPDDENTRFISYSANELLFNTAYLSLTRGDGGQNLVGTEIREELGIIRTQELLAARRTDGGEQFFTRANDFGYSKTPEETFAIWDKEKILADVVWTIRKFKPDVIVCRFPTDGGGGHGHHTGSAILAEEAFAIAGDKTKFPEQLKYVDVWQPKRVVINTGRWWNDKISADDPGVETLDIGAYNARLGISYNELAARSRTMHKSQGFGSTGSRGSHEEFFEHLAGKESTDGLFTDITTSWKRVKKSEKIQTLTTKLIEEYNSYSPSKNISTLVKLRREVKKLENVFWREKKLKEIDALIIQCAGIYIEAKADEYSKTVGDSLKVSFELVQRASHTEVYLQEISNTELNFKIGEKRKVSYNIKEETEHGFVVPNLKVSQPYWLEKEGTLGTYKVDNQELIGKPENDAPLIFKAIFSFEGEEIEHSFPLIYKWNDPVKGELYRPFIITPKVTANLEQSIYLFSNTSKQEFTLTLKAHSNKQQGNLNLKVAKGWEVSYEKTFTLENKGDEQKIKVTLTPTRKAENGDLQIFINKQPSKAFNSIEYDHIPTQVWFPVSKAKLVFIDIKKQGKKLGYLLGAGDVVPDALRNIGYEVDILEENDLELSNLTKYDAILTGVRFLNVNERADFIMPKLLTYCENGGNLVVQYNTRHRLKTDKIGPFPITISRDRVTEEDADVVFLDEKNSVLNTPNKITQADFKNWVQERGLYFPNEWDEKYTPLFSWHDKNEEAKTGSLLVAKYGEGNYAYSGISFFRELPAGVPGAYRLLVNLIEMGNE